MKIILLTTFENPWGMEMIKLINTHQNFELQAVICSVDIERDQQHKEIIKSRTGNQYIPPSIDSIINQNEFSVPFYFTQSHNNVTTNNILKEYLPEIIVLGGADIIQEAILKIPIKGTINVHPGLLPQYRGCSAVEWSIFNDDPVGAACHYVTTKVDSGKIIFQKEMKIHSGDLYEKIRSNIFKHAAEVLIEALNIIDKNLVFDSLEKSDSRYYKTIDSKSLAAVKEKLVAKRYKNYSK